MTLLITLTIDEGDGAELIGLLAKALGRHELGIIDFKLQAIKPAGPIFAPDPRNPQRISAKPGLTPTGRPRKATGGERFKVLRLSLADGPMSFSQMRAALVKAGFASTGLGSAITQWVKFGLIERTGHGEYRLKKADDAGRAPP
jgi:hypothetical protein